MRGTGGYCIVKMLSSMILNGRWNLGCGGAVAGGGFFTHVKYPTLGASIALFATS